MNEKNYVAPAVEVIDLELETPVLTASGEDSIPGFGE